MELSSSPACQAAGATYEYEFAAKGSTQLDAAEQPSTLEGLAPCVKTVGKLKELARLVWADNYPELFKLECDELEAENHLMTAGPPPWPPPSRRRATSSSRR